MLDFSSQYIPYLLTLLTAISGCYITVCLTQFVKSNQPHHNFTYCITLVCAQAVFLADFKQIKKIQCLSQSDGKALVNFDIEGAKQVSTTITLSILLYNSTLYRIRIAKISKYLHYRERLHRKFDRVHVLTL